MLLVTMSYTSIFLDNIFTPTKFISGHIAGDAIQTLAKPSHGQDLPNPWGHGSNVHKGNE